MSQNFANLVLNEITDLNNDFEDLINNLPNSEEKDRLFKLSIPLSRAITNYKEKVEIEAASLHYPWDEADHEALSKLIEYWKYKLKVFESKYVHLVDKLKGVRASEESSLKQKHNKEFKAQK